MNPLFDFGACLHRILPARDFLGTNGGDEAHWPVAKSGADALAIAAGRPGGLDIAAALMIDEQNGAMLLDDREVEFHERGTAHIGNEAGVRFYLFDLGVPMCDEFCQRRAAPGGPGLPDGVGGGAGFRQLKTAGGSKIVFAGFAVADPVALPAIAEERVDVVFLGDLDDDLGHEIEIVARIGAGDVDAGHGPVFARLTVDSQRHPFGMRLGGIGVDGVRIDAGHDVHVEFSRLGHQRAERVGVADEFRDVVERDFARIVSDIAAGREADGVGLGALEHVDPEGGIVALRVVLNESELGPARGGLVPVGRAQTGRGWAVFDF